MSYNESDKKRYFIVAERSVSVDKDIKKSISATDKDAQYDEKARDQLGHKIILAHILVKTIDRI